MLVTKIDLFFVCYREMVDTELNLSQDEIKKRAEYLRQQRDKIIKMRQKERTDRISKYLTKERATSARPKTAKRNQENGPEQNGDDETLAYRKTLAARLKAEVIDRR